MKTLFKFIVLIIVIISQIISTVWWFVCLPVVTVLRFPILFFDVCVEVVLLSIDADEELRGQFEKSYEKMMRF